MSDEFLIYSIHGAFYVELLVFLSITPNHQKSLTIFIDFRIDLLDARPKNYIDLKAIVGFCF